MLEVTTGQHTRWELAEMLRNKTIKGIKIDEQDNSFSIRFEDSSILKIEAQHAAYANDTGLDISLTGATGDWL